MTSIPPIARDAPPIGIPPMVFATTSSTHCPSCQAPVEPDENFCNLCGFQVAVAPRQCTHCRGYPAPDDKFCIFCGTPLPQGVG